MSLVSAEEAILAIPRSIHWRIGILGKNRAERNGTNSASEERTLQRAGIEGMRLGNVEDGRGYAGPRMSMFPSAGSLLPHNDRRTSVRGPASSVISRGHTRGRF